MSNIWNDYKNVLEKQIKSIEALISKKETSDRIECGACVLATYHLLNQIDTIEEAKRAIFWSEIRDDVIELVDLTNQFIVEEEGS